MDNYIEFPLENLDITDYLPKRKQNTKHVYDLFSVSNHYGSLSGGHYTAFCKNVMRNKWFEFDDSSVS